MLRRAIRRGELPVDLDLELGADLIAAPLYWRLAVTRQAFDQGDLERLVEMTVAGLGGSTGPD